MRHLHTTTYKAISWILIFPKSTSSYLESVAPPTWTRYYPVTFTMDAAAMEFARLVVRQDAAATTPACTGSNDYNGRMGVRISSVFVILVSSLAGKSHPVHDMFRRFLLVAHSTTRALQLYLIALHNLTATLCITY